jgi:hypothetical protein
VTISERAAGRGFVLGSEGLGFLAVLTAGVGFEVLWRLRHSTNALVQATESSDADECAYDIPGIERNSRTSMDAFGEWKCGWPSSSLLISSSDSPCRIEYPPTLWVPETASPYAT